MCMNTCTVSCFIYLSRNKLTVVKIVLFFCLTLAKDHLNVDCRNELASMQFLIYIKS